MFDAPALPSSAESWPLEMSASTGRNSLLGHGLERSDHLERLTPPITQP
jgi:hypothetical protein